jgi:hypothetical protein
MDLNLGIRREERYVIRLISVLTQISEIKYLLKLFTDHIGY